MFRFKLPALLDPRAARAKAQEEVDRRREETLAALRHKPWEPKRDQPEYGGAFFQEKTPREIQEQHAEQFRHPEVDVDGVLDAAPSRVPSERERRREEIKAARLQDEYNQKRGTKR